MNQVKHASKWHRFYTPSLAQIDSEHASYKICNRRRGSRILHQQTVAHEEGPTTTKNNGFEGKNYFSMIIIYRMLPQSRITS